MSRSSGYTLVEVILTIGVGAIAIGGATAFLAHNSTIQAEAWEVAEVIQFRQKIFETLNSDLAWKNTLEATRNSSAVACLEDAANCAPGRTGASFALYDEHNNLVYDSANARQGFTAGGITCNEFQRDQGERVGQNSNCPYRYDVRWTRDCLPGNCANSLVRIVARLEVAHPEDAAAKNLDRYSMVAFYRENKGAGPALPSGCSIVHTPNTRTFRVNWTAGSGNGSCRIQYERKDGGGWPQIRGNVDCDSPGSAVGPIYIIGDGWPNGRWDSPVPFMLVRNSDAEVMCMLGELTCTPRPGSPVSTQNFDEDCDADWDNTNWEDDPEPACTESVPTTTYVGDTYTCAATISTPCGTRNFLYAQFILNYAEYSTNPTCSGLAQLDRVVAQVTTPTGTVPASGYLESFPTVTLPINNAPRCYDSTSGITIPSPTLQSVRLLNMDRRWSRAACIYHPQAATTYY